MRRTRGCGSGLFKQDNPRAIDRHIDYFGDDVESHCRIEPRHSRRAPGPIEGRESVVVIVGPVATRRRAPALAGAR